MNQPRDRHLNKLAAIFSVLLLATAASFGVPATTALTLQINGDGSIASFTNGQQLVIDKGYSMTAKAKNGFTFTGWTGSQASNKPKLTFTMAAGMNFTANFADEEKPTLSMTAPPDSKKLISDAVIVTGKAKDNVAVTNVFYSLNGADWQPASTGNGWSNWWVSVMLNANTNTLQAYAVDSSGNTSKTNKVNMTFIAVPVSLDGLTAFTADGTNDGFDSFGTGTFSEDTRVGTYTFKKINAARCKVFLTYTAPPSATNDGTTAYLQFTNTDAGLFTNTFGGGGAFQFLQATNTTPVQLAGTSIVITNGSGESTNLTFPGNPLIVDNGHMFNVSNPLVISLSSSYDGQTNDRVSVPFTQLKNISGQWVQTGTPVLYGTVIGFDTNANTVTVLFDNSSFLSKTELFAPATGNPVNILTFYFTNFLEGATVTNGAGTYTFTLYSPVGGLLKLDGKTYFVLTFVDADSGGYYEESGTNSDSGSFGLTLPPQITSQPQSVTTTNGGQAAFSLTAIGSPPLTYQWQMNGTNLTDGTTGWGSTISGSTNNILTLTTVTNSDAGKYQIVVANDFGTVTSSVATLTIDSTNSSPPGP